MNILLSGGPEITAEDAFNDLSALKYALHNTWSLALLISSDLADAVLKRQAALGREKSNKWKLSNS